MTKDEVSAIFIISIGGFYLIYSLDYNTGSLANPQHGFFPRIIGIALVASNLVLLLSSLFKRKQKDKLSTIWEGIDPKNIVSALMVIGSLSLYLLVINYVGFLVASPALVFFLAWVMGGKKWIYNIILGVVTGGLLYWIFWIMMRVPIPLGSLWGK